MDTFNEWFAAKHSGQTFEEVHQVPGTLYDDSFRALSKLLREYVSEMVAKNIGDSK